MITYKDISNLDNYKKSANEILGGYGNQSDNTILDNSKEIYIDDKLVGYISFDEFDDVEGYNKVLGIGNFMILERGKGYGTQVLEDLISKYKGEYDLIYCFVDSDNEGAIKLYKKLGTVYDEDGPNDNGQYYVTFYDISEQDKLMEARKKNKQKKTDYTLPQSKFKTVSDIMKWTKKRQKGLGAFVTYDVGNMDYNASLFNRMMGSGDAITSGGTSADAAATSSGSMMSGGGMGESFSLNIADADSRKTLTEARELSARPDVQKFLENNIELLEKDPEGFITHALIDLASYHNTLDRIDLSNLFRILHTVGVDVTTSAISAVGYDHMYIDYDTIGADEDYLNILDNLVSIVPNRYIDKKWWEGKTAQQVIDAIRDQLKYQIESTMPPEDMDSDVLGVRVECFVLGNGFDQSDRRIGVQIIVETHNDIGVIELECFGNIFLDSLGYMLNKQHANGWLDEYKRDIEIGLKHLKN